MSLPHDTMLRLMAYADGELEGDELHATERLIAENAEARRFVESIAEPAIPAWLANESFIAKAPLAPITDAVMAKIAADPDARTPSTVRSLDEARERRSARLRFSAGIAAIAAVAAGILAYVGAQGPSAPRNPGPVANTPPQQQETAPVETAVPTPPPAPTSQQAMAAAEEQGVEVNEVESPSHDVSVFYIPEQVGATANMNPTSVVIWIDDAPPGGK